MVSLSPAGDADVLMSFWRCQAVHATWERRSGILGRLQPLPRAHPLIIRNGELDRSYRDNALALRSTMCRDSTCGLPSAAQPTGYHPMSEKLSARLLCCCCGRASYHQSGSRWNIKRRNSCSCRLPRAHQSICEYGLSQRLNLDQCVVRSNRQMNQPAKLMR